MTHKNCGGEVVGMLDNRSAEPDLSQAIMVVVYTCKRCGEVPESEVEDEPA